MPVMPHRNSLTAIVSTAWTISNPLGYVCVWEHVHTHGSRTTHELLLWQLHAS